MMLRKVSVLFICIVNLLVFTSDAQPFTEVDTGLPDICCGSVAWGDYDTDGDLDLFVSGISGEGLISHIYRNDGGTFTDIEAGLPGVYEGAAAWGDFDQDNDLDLVITGDLEDAEPIARIYRNNEGRFSDVGAALTGAVFTAVAWGDYDHDGDLDLLINGRNSGKNSARVYKNDNGVFVETQPLLSGGGLGSANWIDYDNDGDMDVLVTGSYFGPTDGFFPRTRLYRNENDVYVDTEVTLLPFWESASAWGDYDNDGDLDLIVTGTSEAEDGSAVRVAQLYNNMAGNLIPAQTDIVAASRGSVAWGDYDNDGDLDLVITGIVDDSRIKVTHLYRNENGFFSQVNQEFPGIAEGQAIWGDYDNDGDLDLLIAGEDARPYKMHLYRNNQEDRNQVPNAPTGLRVTELRAQTATLCWHAAADDTTPMQALSYNLRVGTDAGSNNVMPPMSLLHGEQEGKRLVVDAGNVGQGTCVQLKGLTLNTTYFASVQAVDHGFAGSAFSAELSFTPGMEVALEQASEIPAAVQVDAVYPNPFHTSVEIRYTLSEATPVVLTIYDLMGRAVYHLEEQWLAAGAHSITWEAGDLPSGVYLCHLTAGRVTQIKQLVLVK